MAVSDPVPEPSRLDSWKQIAAYLDKSERTVRRWQETEGLPVHKHQHQQRGTVWAYRHELDEWLAKRRVSPEPLLDAPKRSPWPTVVTIVAVVAAGVAGWRDNQRAPTLAAPVPFTSLPGSAIGPSFAPDGERVAFVWLSEEPAKSGIYLKSMQAEQATPLVLQSTEAQDFVFNPAWSPDGQTLAFLRRTREQETWLCLIAPTGGPERRLIRLATFSTYFANQQHLSWGPDSQWLLAPIAASPTVRAIHRVSLNGDARSVTDPQGSSAYAPSLAPDGRSFVYLRREGAAETALTEVWKQPLQPDFTPQGKPQLLYRATGLFSGAAWAPNGREFVYCLGPNAPLAEASGNRLYRLRMTPEAQEPQPVAAGDCNTLAVSRPDADGSATLIFGNVRSPQAALRQARLDSLSSQSAFAPSSRRDTAPAFSPDGKSIAFVSDRSGQPEVWVAQQDGTALRRVTENSRIRSRPQWSPDGSRLLFGVAPAALAIVPIAGGSLTAVPLGGQLAQHPVWSRDGTRLYYSSKNQLWRSRLNGSDRQMVLDGYRYSAVGESGQSLYYTRPGKRLVLGRVPIAGGPEEVLEADLATNFVEMTPTALYYLRDTLYRRPFAGAARPFDPLPTLNRFLGFTVSPDDTRLIWSAAQAPQIDLELVRKFR